MRSKSYPRSFNSSTSFLQVVQVGFSYTVRRSPIWNPGSLSIRLRGTRASFDSNLQKTKRHLVKKRVAFLVMRSARFERATSASGGQRSIQLSYERVRPEWEANKPSSVSVASDP